MSTTDFTGKRFGLLTGVKRLPNRGRQPIWLFSCDCGGAIQTSPYNVRNGSPNDCGCVPKMCGKYQRTPRISRPIRIDGEIAHIPLSQGLEAIIDACDIPLVEKWPWHAAKNGGTWYARARSNNKLIHLHRVITLAPDGLVVDHKDGDGLNNRRYNLRVCTHKQNAHNSSPKKYTKLGVPGVSFEWNRYRARIKIDGRMTQLGSFDTLEEAKLVYEEAASKQYGEFAYDPITRQRQ